MTYQTQMAIARLDDGSVIEQTTSVYDLQVRLSEVLKVIGSERATTTFRYLESGIRDA